MKHYHRPALAAFAAIASLSLSACGDDRLPDYSYEMTVHADGETFSTVRHVEVTEGSIVTRRVTGEAVIIDHPNGRTYYALLSRPENPDYAKYAAGMALRDHVAKPASKSEVEKAMDEYDENRGYQDSFADPAKFLQAMVEIEGAKDLPRTIPATRNRPPMQAWPMFVTFGNPDDPKTVREVTPASIGVERITIEITDEDVTTGIEDRLGWLVRLKGGYLSGRSSARGSPFGMHAGFFSSETFE